ncbi:antihemorrhagic factor cHLP-B-like [Stigmatopora argus]
MMAIHLLASGLLFCALTFPGILTLSSRSDITCGEESVEVVANFAVLYINQKHKHGFKFKLQEIQGSEYQQFSGGCHIDVNLKLLETLCHFTNPKPHQECELRRRKERGAVASCSVEFWVMLSMAKITKYHCTTKPERTNDEVMTTCPYCPKFLSLDDPTGVSAVHQAVEHFNRGSKHDSYFTLMEVAQLTEGYAMTIGTITWLKFALIETTCPREATLSFAACTPRCPDRAHHVFCQTAYYNTHQQVGQLDCETYPPKNSELLPAGQAEPVCRPLFHQSAEACACKDMLESPEVSIHHICPFPLK